jgi:hypothetical protein
MRYVSERAHQMRYRIGLQTGEKLNAYGDKNLRRVYSRDELFWIGADSETVQIANPANPDDPYDMIDTTIYNPFDPSGDYSWILYPNEYFRSNDWKEIKSVGISYKYYGKDSLLYRYRRSDLDSRLLPEEKRLLQAYLNYANPAGRQMESIAVSDTLLKKFMLAWYDSVSTALYHKIENGEIKIFRNDSLEGELSLKDLEKLGGNCFTVQISNPANPNDPYDMIDTTVCDPFNPSDLKGFSAAYDWTARATGSCNSLRGIGLLFSQMLAEIELPERSMFWIKTEDAQKFIPQQDWLLMTELFNFQLLSSVEKDYYTR